MKKNIHEFRDPIHVFIRMDSEERKIVDSRPFQRLRQIHQLAMTYLVYPGATHRRFEHSLGVMELASRVYNIITDSSETDDRVRDILPPSEDKKMYWQKVLRMASLCHDLGHLPFSHAAEKELLSDGLDHEKLTADIINSSEMKKIWNEVTPPLRPKDITKIAIGPQKSKEIGLGDFNDWEAILSEIISGNTFGVDRMDYLLRDSLHAGVAYGKFDHYRLIDTLRILPKSEDSDEPTLGLIEGGLQSAESLLWARYFMFSQVYCHPVRRIYDIHLQDFLKSWLPDGRFPIKLDDYLNLTDCEIIAELRKSSQEDTHPSHKYAKLIIDRNHFKPIYRRNPIDQDINPSAAESVYAKLSEKFSKDKFKLDSYTQKGGSEIFPVQIKDGRILQSNVLSDTLQKVPIVAIDYVFADRTILEDAEKWLEENHDEIIQPVQEQEA
ncbi:MAG: HD domain-containing protein [Sedimentisphaerales bacterium]